jgi:type III secretion system low calcium response chaperone LcrH/SycD
MYDIKSAIDHTLQGLNVPASKIKRWTAKEAETIYASAYSLYETSQYSQAGDIFLQLIFSNSFEQKYWRGLAASRQMESKFEEALHAWSLVALLVEQDPLPHFYAAECFISLKNKEEALIALLAAEERLKDDGQSHLLHAKIECLKQAM